MAASFTLSVCPHASPTSLFGIDVSLVAVSLATLFAIVRRSDLAIVMDKESLTDIFQVRERERGGQYISSTHYIDYDLSLSQHMIINFIYFISIIHRNV